MSSSTFRHDAPSTRSTTLKDEEVESGIFKLPRPAVFYPPYYVKDGWMTWTSLPHQEYANNLIVINFDKEKEKESKENRTESDTAWKEKIAREKIYFQSMLTYKRSCSPSVQTTRVIAEEPQTFLSERDICEVSCHLPCSVYSSNGIRCVLESLGLRLSTISKLIDPD